MPLLRTAEISIVVSSDLKGLGANNGPPLTYLWTPPSIWPVVAPWLAVAALLFLPSNRSLRAWWVVCPLVLAFFAVSPIAARFFAYMGPSDFAPTLEMMYSSFAFGAAAVWLLAPHLQHRWRLVAGLKTLLVCALMTAFAYFLREDWSKGEDLVAYGIFLGICVLLSVVSLNLAGLLCRRRYRRLALALWFAVFMAFLPLAIALPILMATSGVGNGLVPWSEVLTVLLGPAGSCYAILLVFLALAFGSSLYRQRLKDLLHLEPAAAPIPLAVTPILTPEPLERSSK